MRVNGRTQHSVSHIRIGTTLIAVLLTFGLTTMRVSAEVYPEGDYAAQDNQVETADTDQVIAYQPIELAKIVSERVDCKVVACIALTFDDGPDQTTTPQVLDALKKANAHATFFVVGSRVGANVSILRRMIIDGDEVGNHTWNHPDLTKLSSPLIKDQVARTQAAVIGAGLAAPIYFRPPYESRNDRVRQAINMPFILWNIDTKDWKQKTVNDIVTEAVKNIKAGSIIIMHDTKPLTVQALPKILEQLKTQYHLVTISELLNLPAGAVGEFRSQ